MVRTAPNNQPTPQQAQPTPQQAAPPPDPNPNNNQNQRRGRQAGSQGYSEEDSMALCDAVKHVLPLGSNDWERVRELYSQYADHHQRNQRDAEPLKTKFRTMVNAKKPTGDPNIKESIRYTKRVSNMIKERAYLLSHTDADRDDEEESDDERNGIGNPIPASPDQALSNVKESLGTRMSGFSSRQTQVTEDNESSMVDDRNRMTTKEDEYLPDESDLTRSTQTSGPGANPRQSQSPTNYCLQATPSTSQTGSTPSTSQTQSTASSARTQGTGAGLGPARRSRSSQGSLQVALLGHFDPEACRQRDHENGLTQMLNRQLQDANNTINRLHDEINCLRDGINLQIMRLQEELQLTWTELAQKTAEMQNLSLNHRMELMQARMDAAQSGMFMQSMPAMMGGGMFPRACNLKNSLIPRSILLKYTSINFLHLNMIFLADLGRE
ncbi:hypothetical protein KEM48_003815 [Puccinia striiformis f. sp. tritici PST-130]|nr:hypothetical protein KEM48_003815 [Puccinia striiformis f. sp. tritici PST-130]